ncbi:MAG: ATP-dependent protease ATPase subunit HslU [Clostridiales bacterium]|nr:ATP-dependent protease ATPase subunit HslU [Clostridiales bacterium]
MAKERVEMTPSEIVQALDKYIIGQDQAKKVVAVALRNRYRRSCLSDKDREEITPKNIILKGPTGVGKTEIARRLAKLVKAPFLKVEATKYTEVGYVGRDVESMIRDLVEVSIRLVKDERYKEVRDKARATAINKVADLLLKNKEDLPENIEKQSVKDEIAAGHLDQLTVEISVTEMPQAIDMGNGGGEINIGNIFGDFMPKKVKKRRVTVENALRILTEEESEKLIDNDNVNAEAIYRAENDGIIFIDELDKIAGKSQHNGPDVSREGVQRDILPIVEGCTVNTKYGTIKTDHVLFIGSGAFHVAAVSDLIPELQGRFPVIVELNSLSQTDFVRILTEPQNALTKQYQKLLGVDGVDLQFTEDGIEEIASIAVDFNNTKEDIGARRLQSVLEELLSDVSFEAHGEPVILVVDKAFVDEKLSGETMAFNLKKYIL